MRIISPNLEMSMQYFEMCLDYKNDTKIAYHLTMIEEAKNRIIRDLQLEKGVCPEGYIQQKQFWFLDDNEKIVGTSRIRPKLNDRFYVVGGHIGYDVAPSFRRHGIGTEILRLSLLEAYKIIDEDIIITCNDDNIGSYRIIEKNNGILDSVFYDDIKARKMRRYKIKVNTIS